MWCSFYAKIVSAASCRDRHALHDGTVGSDFEAVIILANPLRIAPEIRMPSMFLKGARLVIEFRIGHSRLHVFNHLAAADSTAPLRPGIVRSANSLRLKRRAKRYDYRALTSSPFLPQRGRVCLQRCCRTPGETMEMTGAAMEVERFSCFEFWFDHEASLQSSMIRNSPIGPEQ